MWEALADGADRALDMRISANLFDEVLVTSSGTTAGFETYDFDSCTGSITITGVFPGPGESITISEVRLLEWRCARCVPNVKVFAARS